MVSDTSYEALRQNDLPFCSQLGARFHRLIIEKSTNWPLFPVLDNPEGHTRWLRMLADRIFGGLEKSSDKPRQILDASKHGDPLAYEQAVRHHLIECAS